MIHSPANLARAKAEGQLFVAVSLSSIILLYHFESPLRRGRLYRSRLKIKNPGALVPG
jgi:hypothetical protein